MLKIRHLALKRLGHGLMVEAAEGLGNGECMGLAMAEHEGELVLAEDGHHRVEDDAEPEAGDVENNELPAIGKLARKNVVLSEAKPVEPGRSTPGQTVDLGIGEVTPCAGTDYDAHQSDGIWLLGEADVEIVEQGLARPEAFGLHPGAARLDEDSVELHGFLPFSWISC